MKVESLPIGTTLIKNLYYLIGGIIVGPVW